MAHLKLDSPVQWFSNSLESSPPPHAWKAQGQEWYLLYPDYCLVSSGVASLGSQPGCQQQPLPLGPAADQYPLLLQLRPDPVPFRVSWKQRHSGAAAQLIITAPAAQQPQQPCCSLDTG